MPASTIRRFCEWVIESCHMGKGTGTGEEEIYLHGEEPALYLLPSLADHSYATTPAATQAAVHKYSMEALGLL